MQTLSASTAAPRRATSILDTHVDPAVLVAAVCVVLVAMRHAVTMNIGLGTITALALAPVWLPRLRRFHGARFLLATVLLAVLSGVWLTDLSSVDHLTSTKLMIATSVTAMNFAVGTGVVLWARTLMPRSVVAMLFGVGLFAGLSTGGRFAENPWRFGFAVPTLVLLLGWAWFLGRRWLEVALALALGAVSAFQDGRSMFAMLLLSAVLVGWYALPRTTNRVSGRLRVIMLLVMLAAVAYQGGQALILDGYLGEHTRARTEAQIETSGSLLLGARPELGATAALMAHQPIGYGSGTSATMEDLMVAKSGMAALNYDPNNGYVEDYMFGTAMELHSIVGDLWVLYGIPGLLMAGAIGWLVVQGMAGDLARRRPHALAIYLAVSALWNLAFGPFYTTSGLLALAVGLLLPRAPQRRAYSEKT